MIKSELYELSYKLLQMNKNFITFNMISREILYISIQNYLNSSKSKNKKKPDYLNRWSYQRVIEELELNSIISQVGSNIYQVNNKKQTEVTSDICSLYSQGYISHLSALDFYGLSNKIPKIIYFTVPQKNVWTQEAKTSVKKNMGDIEYNKYYDDYSYKFLKLYDEYPNLTHFLGYDVKVISSKSYNENQYQVLPDYKNMRVKKLVFLFLDMLIKPNFFGGEQHVFDVFFNIDQKLYPMIVENARLFSSDINKARIGFLLNTVLKYENEIFDIWKRECKDKRGNSRKLIPSRKYSPVYSPEWNISINTPILEQFGQINE